MEQTLNNQLDIIETIKSELSRKNFQFSYAEDTDRFEFTLQCGNPENIEMIFVRKHEPKVDFQIWLMSSGTVLLNNRCGLPSQDDTRSYHNFYKLMGTFIAKSKVVRSKGLT